jgi:cytidine deaminase
MKQVLKIVQKLKPQAMRAAANSYSPYSGFQVGVAVCGRDGTVYGGCNVENASLGITQCAERCAISTAISCGEKRGTLTELLIYTPGSRAHAPCGACRQVMHELMAENSVVVSCCDTDDVMAWTRSEYLPDAFTPESLLDEMNPAKSS